MKTHPCFNTDFFLCKKDNFPLKKNLILCSYVKNWARRFYVLCQKKMNKKKMKTPVCPIFTIKTVGLRSLDMLS